MRPILETSSMAVSHDICAYCLCEQGQLDQLGVNLSVRDDTEDFSLLRRALVTGLFQNTARRQPDGRYRLYSTSQVSLIQMCMLLWLCARSSQTSHEAYFQRVGLSIFETCLPLTIVHLQEVYLHPGSVLMTIPAVERPACIVFDEVVLTNKAYAQTATSIEPGWLPELVPQFFVRKVIGGA